MSTIAHGHCTARLLRLAFLAASLVALGAPSAPRAWIWPEHRDIAAEALKDLPAAQRKTLDAMWADARSLGGKQVCELLVDPGAQPDVKYGEWDGPPGRAIQGAPATPGTTHPGRPRAPEHRSP